MKKLLVTMLSLALIGGAIAAPAAQAKKPKQQKSITEHGDYQAPSAIVLAACSNTGAVGCVEFAPPSASLKWITVKVTDATGLPVSGMIAQPDGTNTGGVSNNVTVATFCGSTKAPVAINPTQTVHVWVSDQPSTSCAPAAATQGTVDVTFQAAP
ncbi:MAG: hypothetical protein ABR579_09935 [Actinomycetota bacterium]